MKTALEDLQRSPENRLSPTSYCRPSAKPRQFQMGCSANSFGGPFEDNDVLAEVTENLADLAVSCSYQSVELLVRGADCW